MATRTDPEVIEDGRAIEDEANEPTEEDDDGQFVIPGSAPGMTTSAGGRKPNFSEAKLRSIPLRLTGEFKKGDEVRLVIDCVVQDVRFPDEYKDGEIVRTRRVHIFSPVAVEAEPSD